MPEDLNAYTECPSCGGAIYDNRRKNTERIAAGQKAMPDFSCKDKEGCGWKKWPPKNAVRPSASPPVSKPTAHHPGYTLPQLATLYDQLLCKAVSIVDKRLSPTLTKSADVYLSAAATMYIAATREGVKPISDE